MESCIADHTDELFQNEDFVKFLNFLDEQLNFLAYVHQHTRHHRLKESREGFPPEYKRSSVVNGDWKIEIPEWVSDQRNQMTGPADDAKLCVRMINSGSPGVMLDLEDSLANNWKSLKKGYQNIKKALDGSLTFLNQKTDKVEGIHPLSKAVVFTRVRGLHLNQIINKTSYSAPLFDLAALTFDLEEKSLKHPLCIYIPKSESEVEAHWWASLFETIEELKGWTRGTIKCMALVESHPLAYEMEEFIYNLRNHIVGLNLGRWDYMASLLDFNYNNPDWLFPDRNTIPLEVEFFQNLRLRMAQVCHQRGILAIGGMTALYPDRKDAEFNARALSVLKLDKENEAACFMDGAWTGHPDQNEIAVGAFPEPNQLDVLPGKQWIESNLRSFPERESLSITEEGTRDAIRTCIQYRQAVIEGKGAKLINGYMEDLATDRIYRILIAQRIDHGVHSKDEVMDMFRKETVRLYEEYPDTNWLRGRDATEDLIYSRQFNPR